MGRGYWHKTTQCLQCQKQEGYSPRGKLDRGIDSSGLCESCRWYNANKWSCAICQLPVEWKQRGIVLNGITQEVTRGHLTCLADAGMKPRWAGR